MGQTWMLLIISVLFVIAHHNQVLLIGIYDTVALVWQEKLFLPPFFVESKFIYQLRQTWILIIISIFYMIQHYNHVLLIGIHDIGDLVWQEKLFSLPFFIESKFIRQLRQTTIPIIIFFFL